MEKWSETMAPSSASQRPVRGQAAIEVLVYMGFFMMIFVSLSVMFLSQINQDVVQREYRLSQSIAAQIADDVNTAQLAGPGFNATFPIPRQISGRNYFLNFSDQGILSIQLQPKGKDLAFTQYNVTTFTFPLSTRNIRLGCAGPNPACPGNGQVSGLPGYDLALHSYWWVNASRGTLGVANIANSSYAAILQVS